MGIHTDGRYRTVEEAQIVELLLIHGWAFETRSGARAPAERAAKAALDRLVSLGLAYRLSRQGIRSFDPAEVLNFVHWAGIRHGEPTWERHFVMTARRHAWEMHGHGNDAEGIAPSPALLGPQHYAVTLRRTFNLADREQGTRVRLRLPLPIEDASLRELRLRFIPPPIEPCHVEVGPARLDAVVEVPAERETTLGIEADFVARPWVPVKPAGTIEPAEADLYTRPNEGLIKVSDRVAALAADLAEGESDLEAVARRYWSFMLDGLAYGMVHYDQLEPAKPTDWVLEHGWSDCQIGSALLAALCRARGIPARLATGYVLHPTAPGFHTWLELWFADTGWMPVDLLCWDLSAGGRDTAWRDYYFGQLDHRMAIERPPRLFNGAGSVRLPKIWHCLSALEESGTSIAFVDCDTGRLAYRDHIEVERGNDRIENPRDCVTGRCLATNSYFPPRGIVQQTRQ